VVLVVLLQVGVLGFAQAEKAGGTFSGMNSPGAEPQRFPAELGKVGPPHGRLVFDGAEGILYTTYGDAALIARASVDGEHLSEPLLLERWAEFGPCGIDLSADGELLVMGGFDAAKQSDEVYGLFSARRTTTGWTSPQPIEPSFREDGYASDPSLAKDGTLYFGGRRDGKQMGVYRMEPQVDGYSEPVRLAGGINDIRVGDPFVDPDERFMLVSGRGPENVSFSDIYMSCPTSDGGWGPPQSLAAHLGSSRGHTFDRFASVSPDGRFLFWVRAFGNEFITDNSDYWWISADVLHRCE
jgi:hypothetical protein